MFVTWNKGHIVAVAVEGEERVAFRGCAIADCDGLAYTLTRIDYDIKSIVPIIHRPCCPILVLVGDVSGVGDKDKLLGF